MAGMRGEAPVENKKNEWVLESNATSDPALARLIEVVDDQSDTALWMRSHLGTFESSDLEHLRETAAFANSAEAALKGSERSAFEALRAREAEREHVERERARHRAAAAAATAAAAAARAKPTRLAVVSVAKRPAPADDATPAAPGDAAKRARAADPPPQAAPPGAALAGLVAAYSDSDDA